MLQYKFFFYGYGSHSFDFFSYPVPFHLLLFRNLCVGFHIRDHLSSTETEGLSDSDKHRNDTKKFHVKNFYRNFFHKQFRFSTNLPINLSTKLLIHIIHFMYFHVYNYLLLWLFCMVLLFTPCPVTRYAMHRIYANRINSRGMSRDFGMICQSTSRDTNHEQ